MAGHSCTDDLGRKWIQMVTTENQLKEGEKFSEAGEFVEKNNNDIQCVQEYTGTEAR